MVPNISQSPVGLHISLFSLLDELLLVIDLSIERVVVADQVVASEGKLRLDKGGVLSLDGRVDLVPLFVEGLAVIFVLLGAVVLFVSLAHLQGLVEFQRVNLLKDGLEGDERVLQDLVPVVLREVDDHGHEHREGLLLVGLDDVQKVVILEETHGFARHVNRMEFRQRLPGSNTLYRLATILAELQGDIPTALHDPLEQPRDQRLDLVHFADLDDRIQLSEEEDLLGAVGEGPVLQQALKEGDGESAVLG